MPLRSSPLLPNIKSIQRGTVNFNGEGIINVPITAVDRTKAVSICSVKTANASRIQRNWTLFCSSLTSDNQLTLERGSAPTVGNIVEVRWMVIEYNNVKMLYSGTTTSTIITIDPITQNKTMIYFTGYSTSTSNIDYLDNVRGGDWLSNTQYHLHHGSTLTTVHYYIVEFL